MLVKIGDVWVDPLRVVALEWVPAVEPREATRGPVATLPFSGTDLYGVWDVGHPGAPAYVDVLLDVDSESAEVVSAHGVTLDEAAAIVNRCREQHMGSR